jgi:hypothetical protein
LRDFTLRDFTLRDFTLRRRDFTLRRRDFTSNPNGDHGAGVEAGAIDWYMHLPHWSNNAAKDYHHFQPSFPAQTNFPA